MSQVTAKKSLNMSSAIGRRPVIAAPMAAPTIACSLIGVSRTRSGPNRSKSPSVSLKTPPAAPTSSPMKTHVGSRSISWAIAAANRRAIRQLRHAEPPVGPDLRLDGRGVGLRGRSRERLALRDGRHRGSRRSRSARPRCRPRRAGSRLERAGSDPCASHALTSSSGRYFAGSAREWPPWRYVSASTSDGPPPVRARSMTRRATS